MEEGEDKNSEFQVPEDNEDLEDNDAQILDQE